ncbi:hypothetical protein Taro_033761 [Colocasia esculenta]|uniref:Proline-rich protein PRCC n=1 Tax=Colocasia esculenta TaxID=4460 RepID=A0A843VUP3_COLES|nr:hypothetical protein [Colocasia esculenta]
MESLLANYASSDEEGGTGRGDEDREPEKNPRSTPSSLFSSVPPPRSTSSSSSPLFSSLPPPQSSSSSSLFGFLPPPKSSSVPSSLPPPKSVAPSPSPSSSSSSSSSLFSSLPAPKSHKPKAPPPSQPGPKKVVQFRPPINPALLKPDDADEDEDDEDSGMGRRRAQDFASMPLSSIIPAPKHALGLGPSSSRRTIIEADVPAVSTEPAKEEGSGGVSGDQGGYGGQWTGGNAQIGVDGQSGSGALGGDVAGVDSSGWDPSAASYKAYGSYASFQGYDNYSSYGGQWDYGASAAGATSAAEMPETARTATKRGREEIPSEILEVKQDELMKNRPREDQVKLTGIAFGPSYQPASSGKGKPTKLHRRKHQIGSLYFDMRQKEMELAERRAKGFLTKKETQAKYGW